MKVLGYIFVAVMIVGCDSADDPASSRTSTLSALGPGFSVSVDRDMNEIIIYVGESGAPYSGGDYDWDLRSGTVRYHTWEGTTERVHVDLPPKSRNTLVLFELPSEPQVLLLKEGAAGRTIEALKVARGSWKKKSAVLASQVVDSSEGGRLMKLLESRIARNAKSESGRREILAPAPHTTGRTGLP